MEGLIEIWSKDRVGVRLSPYSAFNDMHDSNPIATFKYATKKLSELGIGYLHVVEPVSDDHMMAVPGTVKIAPILHEAFDGAFMINGGYNKATGNEAIASGDADLVSFGTPFIANPDLVKRYAQDAPLTAPDQATMYGGEAHGYTDYPMLADK